MGITHYGNENLRGKYAFILWKCHGRNNGLNFLYAK